MVKIYSKGNVLNIESTLPITEGQVAAIKKNPKKIAHACKDFHLEHTFFKDENGTYVSKVGKTTNGEAGEKDIDDIECAHSNLIHFIDSLVDSGMEEPKKKENDEDVGPDDKKTDNKADEGPDEEESRFFLMKELEGSIHVCGNIPIEEVIETLHAAIIWDMLKSIRHE